MLSRGGSDDPSLIWCTYQRGFPPLPGGGGALGRTTDAGWGCTLRSVQALVGRAMRRSNAGVSLESLLDHAPDGDLPDGAFSIHALLARGTLEPPAWWGAQVASYELAHLSTTPAGAAALRAACIAAVVVQPDATLVLSELTAGGCSCSGCERQHPPGSMPAELTGGVSECGEAAVAPSCTCSPWPLLVLVPLRLQQGDAPPTHAQALQLRALLALPSALGAVSGLPRHSLLLLGGSGVPPARSWWGAQQHDEVRFLALDPHTTRCAAPRLPPVGDPTRAEQLRAFDESLVPQGGWAACASVGASSLDPCLALAFLLPALPSSTAATDAGSAPTACEARFTAAAEWQRNVEAAMAGAQAAAAEAQGGARPPPLFVFAGCDHRSSAVSGCADDAIDGADGDEYDDCRAGEGDAQQEQQRLRAPAAARRSMSQGATVSWEWLRKADGALRGLHERLRRMLHSGRSGSGSVARGGGGVESSPDSDCGGAIPHSRRGRSGSCSSITGQLPAAATE